MLVEVQVKELYFIGAIFHFFYLKTSIFYTSIFVLSGKLLHPHIKRNVPNDLLIENL